MHDESEVCDVKETSFRPCALDTGKSCIPREIRSDLNFLLSLSGIGIVVSPYTPGILHECQNKGVAEIAIRKRMKTKSKIFVG